MGKLLSLQEVAEYLGIAVITVRRLIKKGQMPASKIGGQWRIDPDALDLFIKTRALFLGNIALSQLYFRPAVLDKFRKDSAYYVQESGYHGRLGKKYDQYLEHTGKSNEWVLPPDKRVTDSNMFAELRFWKVRLKNGDMAIVVDPKSFYKLADTEQDKWRPYTILNPQI